MIIGNNLTDVYEKTLDAFKGDMAKEQVSQFGDTIEIINYSCCIKDPQAGRFVFTENRKHSLKYIIGELIWYFSCERSISRIRHYSKFWDHLADKFGNVNSNYGYKIFKKQVGEREKGGGKSQFKYVIDELRRNKDSRRAIMFLNLLDEDYPQMHGTKDFVCTPYLHFLIRDGRLNMLTYMRSNDFIYGFCNDVPFFTILQELVAAMLGIGLGYYYHNAGSEHIYSKHFHLLDYKKVAFESLKNGHIFPKIFPDDLGYLIHQFPIFERKIRNKQHFCNEDKYMPEFTGFLVRRLQEYWK